MKCSEARRQLVEIDSPPPAGGALADHLDSCAACGTYAERLARTVCALNAHHAGAEPDAAFAARVVAALPERRSVIGWAALRLLPVALALILVLTGWIVIEQQRHIVIEESVPTDDLLSWVLGSEENGS